jgi:hypothetical protein
VTTPEKLWAFDHHGDIRANVSLETSQDDRRYNCHSSTAPIAAYVREDVAAEQTAAALRGEAHELDAVRRERDALAARVEALRSGVLDIRYAAYEVTLRGEGEHPAVVCARVLEADTAAAGKGVG